MTNLDDDRYEPVNREVATAVRTVHATIAFTVAYGVSRLIGLDSHTAGEAAVLTGGVALYTAEASGQIAAALNRVSVAIAHVKQTGAKS